MSSDAKIFYIRLRRGIQSSINKGGDKIRKNYWPFEFWQTPVPRKYTRLFRGRFEGQLIPVHLNATRENGQIYHANCHCGRDNMLNAARAVSISLFRHTRAERATGEVLLLEIPLLPFSIPPRLPFPRGHACRILIEGMPIASFRRRDAPTARARVATEFPF